MMSYRADRWYDPYLLLFQLRGSVLPEVFVVCCLSGLWCFSLKFWDLLPEDDTNGSGLMFHPNTLIFFLQTAGIAMAFYANQAYSRFWEARGHLQTMGGCFASAASTAVGFMSTDTAITGFRYVAEEQDIQNVTWKSYMLHLISVLHAVCIQYLFSADGSDTPLEILGGFSEGEARELAAVDDHAFLVSHWITIETAKKGSSNKPLPAPVVGKIVADVTAGVAAFNQACKVEDTLFPLPYVQLLTAVDVAVMTVAPVVVACFNIDAAFAVVITILVTGTFHGIFRASQLMQSPCGNRPNDLPLIDLHKDFIGRLQSLLDPPVADKLKDMKMKAQLLSGALQYSPAPVIARQTKAGTVEVADEGDSSSEYTTGTKPPIPCVTSQPVLHARARPIMQIKRMATAEKLLPQSKRRMNRTPQAEEVLNPSIGDFHDGQFEARIDVDPEKSSSTDTHVFSVKGA